MQFGSGHQVFSKPISTQVSNTAQQSVVREYILVKPLEDRFNCMVCHGVQKEPVLVSCCGQHFCQTCLTQWLNVGLVKHCPHCNGEVGNYMLNKQQERDINELEVYCYNRDKGCTWRGTVRTIGDHIGPDGDSTPNTRAHTLLGPGLAYKPQQTTTFCEYEKILCSKKCKQKILKNQLKYHIENDCLCRDYKCEHCGQRGTYHTITGECGEFGPCEVHTESHYNTCPQFPVQCPNCFAAIKRKEVTAHRETCPLEPVECSFSEVGCDVPLVRRDLDNHLATSDHHHLVLTMTALVACRKEVAQLKQARK